MDILNIEDSFISNLSPILQLKSRKSLNSLDVLSTINYDS
jgi:hypothetical protein